MHHTKYLGNRARPLQGQGNQTTVDRRNAIPWHITCATWHIDTDTCAISTLLPSKLIGNCCHAPCIQRLKIAAVKVSRYFQKQHKTSRGAICLPCIVHPTFSQYNTQTPSFLACRWYGHMCPQCDVSTPSTPWSWHVTLISGQMCPQSDYGVAAISRLLKIIRLMCKRAL